MPDLAPEPPPPDADSLGDSRPPIQQETIPDQTAPADLVPTPRWWVRLIWYSCTILFSWLLVYGGLRLDKADLKAPFYYDLDSLLILPMVKATAEGGIFAHWQNDRMGAPGVQELYDFPVIDHLHFAIIWLLGKTVSNIAFLYNLYFLLTFPLTALTAMLVFRHLGLTLPAAAVGALLYAFLPYHYQRWENHYFLAAYWMVPLSLLPVFAILKGRLPFFRQSPDGSFHLQLRTWGTLGQVALAAAVAAAGAYYAFFACALTAFAGCYAWVVLRTWRAAASAGGVVALVFAFGVLNHAPTFVYQWQHGWNPVTDRLPEGADIYGLKIAHLIMPIEDHRLTILRRIKYQYNSDIRPSENENKSASLGVVGLAGLLGLLAAMVLPVRRGWPYTPLAALVLFSILLGTIGGFGSVFNLLVTARIRGYNRISVYIAFLCFFAALWAIDRFWVTRRNRVQAKHPAFLAVAFLVVWNGLKQRMAGSPSAWAKRWLTTLGTRTVAVRSFQYPAWAAVFLIGFLDQVPYSWFQHDIADTLGEQANRFRADAQFFAEIEELMPAGSKIFCLPYLPFPESPRLNKLEAYEHARGYIHTGTLIWSFGAMKGREADAWQQDATYPTTTARTQERLEFETEHFLRRIVYRGFDGLLIDKRGYAMQQNLNRPQTIITEIQNRYRALTGQRTAKLTEIFNHQYDTEQVFLDLRPYRDALRALDAVDFEAKSKEERERVAVLWLDGFHTPDPTYRDSPPSGTVWFINPSDRTRTFRISMTVGVHGMGVFHFRFSGLLDDEFDVERNPGDWEQRNYGLEKVDTIVVPPGRHALRIRCTPPSSFIASDFRKLCYFIQNFKMEEVR